MKQKIVGSYYFGPDQVEVVLREGIGAEYYHFPEKGKIPRIKIGADYETFEGLLEAILHETIEFAIDRYGCSFKGSRIQTTEQTQYLFVFNHTEFSEINARSAEFLSLSLSDIKKAWKKWNKKQQGNK